ncbi:MAG: DUF4404 family protein [Comamonadaceae bacterium]|nr:DUF4404 family protein [Comamonadaceae bacterium]
MHSLHDGTRSGAAARPRGLRPARDGARRHPPRARDGAGRSLPRGEHGDALEGAAVRLEAGHPGLAGAIRSVLDALGEGRHLTIVPCRATSRFT